MSIANRIEQIENHLKDDYQSIANLGADLTNVDKNIENIAELLDNVYDVLPKTDYEEGSDITLSNTLKGKLDFEDGIVGIGDTSQKSYQGYQMLKNTSTNSGDNNYWYHFGTFDETTGTLTQTTNEAREALIGHRLGGLEKNTTYTLSLYAKSNGYVMSMDLFCYNQQVQGVVSRTSIPLTTEFQKITWTFTTTNDVEYGSGTIVRADNNGTTQVGTDAILTIKDVMLEKGSTAHDWEPYVGEIVSPNPSYPQEVKVVRGKNIFDGIIERGSLANGQNVNSGTAPNWRSTNYIKVSPNTEYAFSVNSIINRIVVSFYTSNKTWINRDSETQGTISDNGLFTTPSNCEYIRFRSYQADYNLFENGDIMIEQGLRATSYLPYNTLEVKIQNKNLCTEMEQGDVSTSTGEASSYQPTTSGFIRSKDYIPVKPSEVITVSYKNTATSSIQIVIFEYNANKTYIGFYYSNASTYTRTLGNETAYIKIRLQDTTNTLSNNTEIQVEYGNTKTSYVEHQEQIKQLSLGEYEFARIPDTNYRDTIVYDIENDKVYKKVVIEEHTGTELAGSFQLSSGYSDSTYLCAFNNNFMVTNYVNTTSLCNYFSGEYVYSVQKVANNMRMGPSALVICVLKSDFADINALNQYFTDNGANIKFLLVRQNPILTEITTTLKDQIKALYNAHSNNGTTIITSNGNLPMIIKVRALKGE